MPSFAQKTISTKKEIRAVTTLKDTNSTNATKNTEEKGISTPDHPYEELKERRINATESKDNLKLDMDFV